MTLFENPIQLAKQVRDLDAAVARWQERMRSGDIDESGPFFGKPPLTEREAFRLIAELKEPEPVRRAWTRWAFRLSDARVNGQVRAGIARVFRFDVHPLEKPEPATLSLREMLERMLRRPGEREIWLSAFSANAAQYRSLAITELVRRNEMARRAGFAGAADVTSPAHDLVGAAERLLFATDDLYGELVPKSIAPWLEAALGRQADQGWPAQLNPRTVRRLLGAPEWYDGLELPPRSLPVPVAAASFVRGLYDLGSAIRFAALPPREPYVIARDPYGLYEHTVGALLAQLTGLARWHMDVLSLSRARAAAQARTLVIVQLIAARTRALEVLVEDSLLRSEGAAARAFEELSHRALGFALPANCLGIFPTIKADAGQRLVAPWLAARWFHQLTSEFDIDWYRNPRGIESLRAELSRVSPTFVDNDTLGASLQAFVDYCQKSL